MNLFNLWRYLPQSAAIVAVAVLLYFLVTALTRVLAPSPPMTFTDERGNTIIIR